MYMKYFLKCISTQELKVWPYHALEESFFTCLLNKLKWSSFLTIYSTLSIQNSWQLHARYGQETLFWGLMRAKSANSIATVIISVLYWKKHCVRLSVWTLDAHCLSPEAIAGAPASSGTTWNRVGSSPTSLGTDYFSGPTDHCMNAYKQCRAVWDSRICSVSLQSINLNSQRIYLLCNYLCVDCRMM